MAEIRFEFEWADPLGARGEELRATWGRCQILVNEHPITRFVDHRAKAYRDWVELPLYPLAEWLALNWWFIAAEMQTPGKHTEADYARRHSMRAAAEGYALPALMLRPLGEYHQVTWDSVSLEHSGIEFIGAGSANVPSLQLDSALRRFVDAVVRRLDDYGVMDTPLQDDWKTIGQLEPDEREFAHVAASLGLHPFEMTEIESRDLVDLSADLPPEMLNDFVAAARPEDFQSQFSRLKQTLARLEHDTPDLPAMRDMRLGFLPTTKHQQPPWLQGYDAARELRTYLGLNGRPITGLAGLAETFQTPSELFFAAIVPDTPVDTIDAVSVLNDTMSPAFATAHRNEEAMVFAVGRCLFDYFVSNRDTSLVTKSRSDAQKRNRAFAAELILPSSMLREIVHDEVLPMDAVEDLANKFNVSSLIVKHQLENHRIAHISED